MASNSLNIKRTAFANITIPNVATTVSTGVYIPKGAIVTGLRWLSADAVTLTGASATVAPRISSVNLCATVNVSNLGASATPVTTALSAAAGILVTVDSELNLIAQASSNSAATASYDFYVDYLYCASHE
jgi:hypothetical protein